MRLMQFSAILLMILLTLKLLLLPQRVTIDSKVNKSRWLLVTGCALLSIQFILQFLLELRTKNIEAALMLNMAFFIPCSSFFSLGIINLQRQGYLSFSEKYIGIPVWLLAIPLSKWSVVAAGILYAGLQFYYTFREMRYLHMLRHTIANYYGSDINALLQWMQWIINIMGLLAIMVPFMIFFQGPLLAVFSIISLAGIFYLVDCFTLYTVSNTQLKVFEAQKNEEEELDEEKDNMQFESEDHTSDNAIDRAGIAVDSWVANRGYLQTGLNLPNAAEAIGIPRYLLSVWLKHKGMRYNDWLTELRINEAKKIMQAHPDWSNEIIAQQCGFSDRSYFQRKFKQLTGLTPIEYVSSQVL